MIRVLLADDEDLIRVALAALLRLETDLDVVAQASDGRAAVDAALAHRPDVAVVDLQMPALDGLAVTAELARVLPSCAVVILTGHGRPPHLQRALDSGAKGFLPKGSPGGALADVIRRVHAGGRYVDPALAADALTAPECPLTPRELEVLRLAGFDTPVEVLRPGGHICPTAPCATTSPPRSASSASPAGPKPSAPPKSTAGCSHRDPARHFAVLCRVSPVYRTNSAQCRMRPAACGHTPLHSIADPQRPERSRAVLAEPVACDM